MPLARPAPRCLRSLGRTQTFERRRDDLTRELTWAEAHSNVYAFTDPEEQRTILATADATGWLYASTAHYFPAAAPSFRTE